MSAIADELSLIRVVRTLWDGRRLIFAVVMSCTSLFGAYAFLATPLYRAEVLASPVAAQGSGLGLAQIASQFSGLASLAGLNLDGDKGQKEVAIATLTSREFLEGFIVEHKLMPMLYRDRWDERRGDWKVSSWRQPPSLEDALITLRKRILAVTEDRRTGLVRVSIEWRDRERAAQWANLLVHDANEKLRAIAIKDSKASQEYLQNELAKTNVIELQESVYRLLEIELKKEMVASVQAEYAFKVIDPARAPDARRFASPRRTLLIVLGVMIGFSLGIALVLARRAQSTRLLDRGNL